MPVWARTPCRTIVRRHFVPRHFFRTGRLTLQINLPSALLHGGPFFHQKVKKDVKPLFFCACLGSYPCRMTVRRHFVPRHFFQTGRLTLQINLPSALLHGGPFFRQNAKMDVKTFFFFVPVFGSYPCRTIVRRHFVPRHFFRTGRLTLQINLPSALFHGEPFFHQKSQMDVKNAVRRSVRNKLP